MAPRRSWRSLVQFLLVAAIPAAMMVADGAVLYCNTVEEIYTAMTSVEAGDSIVIAPGTYEADGLAISGTGAHFASYADGTADAPIVMRSQDPENPATLVGENVGSLTCVRIFGAYWTVQDLHVRNAQKGIVFDNAPHGNVINCTVHDVGYEAIHWRDGSDFGLIDGCHVYNTGLRDAGFGEAIYIGTDKGSWGKYDRDVTYVTIRNCVIGPGVAAEAFDIKEGTEEIIVEYNTIDARGLSDINYADSFIDLKGTRAYVRYNTFLQNGEAELERGIAVIDRGVALSSYEHVIHDNVFHLDSAGLKMVEAYGGTSDVYAWNNVRVPADGDDYSTSIHDFCCAPWYSPPGGTSCFAPLNFGTTDVSEDAVTFSWSAGNGEVLSFVLEYGKTDTNGGMDEDTVVVVVDLVDEIHTVTGLDQDTVYIARIQAVCEDDSSNFSAEIVFRTNNPNDPDAPVSPPEAAVIYDDSLAFGWSEHSYTGEYDVDHSANTKTGASAIEAVFSSYGGLQLKHDGYPASDYSFFFFWVRDDTTYGPDSPVIRLKVNSDRFEFRISSPG